MPNTVVITTPPPRIVVVRNETRTVTLTNAAATTVLSPVASPTTVVLSRGLVGETGATGPVGPAGPLAGEQFYQNVAMATWTMPHTLGRVPNVEVFLTGGERVLPDVVASITTVVATFASPTTGFAVLS